MELFYKIALLLLISKMWESQILGRDRRKSRVKTGKTVIFLWKAGSVVPILPGRKESPFLHVLDPNSPSFYVKCPRKFQKTYNFDIFPTLLQIYTSSLINFRMNLKFDHMPLCEYY